jgi:hypothetical protein
MWDEYPGLAASNAMILLETKNEGLHRREVSPPPLSTNPCLYYRKDSVRSIGSDMLLSGVRERDDECWSGANQLTGKQQARRSASW